MFIKIYISKSALIETSIIESTQFIILPYQLQMQATQETNQETPMTSTTESESKKLDNHAVPRLTSEELYNKVVSEITECFGRSEKVYQAYHIQNIFKRTNYRFLSDLQFHCLVIEIQTLFKGNKTIPQQMAVMRMFHQMIVLLERARTYIAGVLPIMFVETMGNVNDENMFYFIKELKAFYRIWHGYMDNAFLRKIRDQCHISSGINIMEINLNDKYITRQLAKIKHSPLIAQRIITGHADGVFPNGASTFQNKPAYKPKFHSWKKKNNFNKDETISNQTSLLSEQKEKCESFASELNEIPKSQENGQPSPIQTIKKVEESKEIRQIEPKESCNKAENSFINDQRPSKMSEKQQNNDISINPSAQLQAKDQTSDIKSPQKSLQAKQQKEDKANKLKSMYELMLSKRKKTGNKLLVQSGSWQFCDNIVQTPKEKTFKKEIFRMISAEHDLEDEEWIYPEHMFTCSQPEQKPFVFECKFCGSKLQALRENGEEYFREIVCFEMRSGVKRHTQEIPYFQLKKEIKVNEGLFLLHKECFQAVCKGKVDQKKWKLE